MKKFYLVLFSVIGLFSNKNLKSQSIYKDVAPIFYSRCASCHHEHQHAPPMMTYSETVANSAAMVSDLTTGKMPPWHPDTTYTRFNHEHLITTAEKNAIINWVNQGMVAGDTTLAPAPPTFPQYQLNGTPDMILQMPRYHSNATSSDKYDCFVLPTNLTQNRILRAFEIVPGNASIVHHVVIDVDTTGTMVTDTSGSCTSLGNFTLGFYVPGAAPVVYPGQAPLKAGVELKAGSTIRLQIHYPTGSGGQIDSTQIRLYFYPVGATGVRHLYTTVPLQNWSFAIPANTASSVTKSYTVPSTFSVFGIGPHSHKVCTKIINYAYSGIDTIPLIRINKWDFNWQGFYTFPNLVKVPSGYNIFASHYYDNTTANPNNPFNPPQLITVGTATTNEMLFDGVQYLIYQPGDETIDVASLLNNDPLLTVGVNELPLTEVQSYIYPNPANDLLNIYISKKSDYTISIYNITGQLIYKTLTTDDFTTIDTKDISDGLYIIQITDSKSNEKITKKIVLSH